MARLAGRGICCLLLFLVCGKTAAVDGEPLMRSEYSYRRYVTADGLPSIVNQRIYQDGQGFIWVVGTSGAARFDGFECKTFLKGSFANLYHIEESGGVIRLFSNKYMYALTPGGDTLRQAVRFDDYFLTVFSSMTLPAGYGIFYAKGHDDEQYFCAIADTGLVRLIAHEDLNRLEDHDKAWYDETAGLLYLPLTDGISVVNDKGRVAFHAGIHAKCFAGYQHTLWAVATDGLYRAAPDGTFGKVMPCEIDFSTDVMARACADGSLLFSDYSTLYRYDGHRIEKLFEANVIKDFILDREGNLWIATYQGVYNLFSLRFRNYSFATGSDNVRSLVYDATGRRMIAGTLGGKLLEIAGETGRELSYPPNPFTSDVSFEPHGAEVGGTVYLPGPGGFLSLQGRQSRWITFPDALFTFQFVTPLPDGNLLTGGATRLIITTPGGKVLRSITMGDLQQRVYSKPCIDRDGRIWIGGAFGLTIIDGEKITALLSDSLSYCRVMNTDGDGRLWFASGNRLFSAMSEKDIRQVRAFDSQVTNISFTRGGILVVATLDHIHLYGGDMEEGLFFNHQNGFTGVESIRADIVEDGDGQAWFPAVECLTVFNPALLLKEPAKPRLHILAFSTSANHIHWETGDGDNRVLDYRHKHIRFNYIGLSYTSAQHVRYRYRLLGFQDEWSEPVKSRELTFNNLPPGDYRFELFTDAGTDESRSGIQAFPFSIKPAFWQTPWFPAFSIALLIVASIGVTLYVQRRKNRVLLEKLRTEKELNELRISSIRLKAIPHFNANVLSAIEYYIANRSREEAMRILEIYSGFTFKTLSEVDKAARPLSEELAYVKMYLDLEKIRFLDKFDFRIRVEEGVDDGVQLPNMILHTYCENAVKHGLMPRQSGGLLQIHVSQQGRIVCVSVEDNGVGRDYAGTNPYPHSTKQGLHILGRQIELYNRFNREKISQRIDDLYKDGKPEGTRFTVEIPLDYTYINEPLIPH
ncbi:MAG: histidine kinase [Tannerellaceae bacterium]|nr:histidine kinase [Tannerellaceae bacterium]